MQKASALAVLLCLLLSLLVTWQAPPGRVSVSRRDDHPDMPVVAPARLTIVRCKCGGVHF